MYMEIVSIEKKTFEEMVAKFDRFVRRMDAICHRHGEKTMGKWMDNHDVCRMLNISPRTLIMGLWHTAKSTTRRITVPKTCSVSWQLSRTGGRKPDSKARQYE